MLTFIFLIILLCMLYFVVRKVIRQKLIIERLKSELIQCKNSSKEKE
jgi:Na+-transporting methylmalonyl-CoA/oxaloacetate decarboxylase gamma subunit